MIVNNKREIISDTDFAEYIKNVNDAITDISNTPLPKINKENLPSNLKIMLTGLSGVSNNKALDLLFSTKLDVILDKLLDLLMNGDIEKVIASSDELKIILDKIGLGEGSFTGPVSKMFVNSVQASVNSIKFDKTKSKIKKCYLIIKNLKRQSKNIKDKETRKKYDDAVYAFKKILKLMSRIYRSRKLVNEQVMKGLHNIIKE